MAKLTNGIVNLILLSTAALAVVYLRQVPMSAAPESGVEQQIQVKTKVNPGLTNLQGSSPDLRPSPRHGHRNPDRSTPSSTPDPNIRQVLWMNAAEAEDEDLEYYLMQTLNGQKLAWPIKANSRLGFAKPTVIPIKANSKFTIVVVGTSTPNIATIDINGSTGAVINSGSSKQVEFETNAMVASGNLSADGKVQSAQIHIQRSAEALKPGPTFNYRIASARDQGLLIQGTTHSRHREPDNNGVQSVYTANTGAYLKIAGQSAFGSPQRDVSLFTEVTTPMADAKLYVGEVNLRTREENLGQGFFHAECVFPPNRLQAISGEFQVLVHEDTGRDLRLGNRVIVCRKVTPSTSDLNFKIEGFGVNGSGLQKRTLTRLPATSLVSVEAGFTPSNIGTEEPPTPKNHIDLVLRRRGSSVNSPILGWVPAIGAAVQLGKESPIEVSEVSIKPSPGDSPFIDGSRTPTTHDLEIVAMLGDQYLNAGMPLSVELLKTPLRVLDLDSGNLGIVAGSKELVISFPRSQELELGNGDLKVTATEAKDRLVNGKGTPEIRLERLSGQQEFIEPEKAVYSKSRNEITLTYPIGALLVGEYEVTISDLEDVYGNAIEGDDGSAMFKRIIGADPDGSSTNSLPGQVLPGIHGSTGPFVSFQEWTPPREVPDGFNPNDKVETRVARLYFFRDAHRVAQIINRKVRSYNRQGVSVARQLADQSRTKADQFTDARQQAEREAIRKAQETRELERELSEARQTLDSTLNEIQRQSRALQTETDEQQRATIENSINSIDSAAQRLAQQVETLEGKVDSSQQIELDARERAQEAESQEQRARQEQFRREVAAAHADPDTYAPGVPGSADPIEQTSISVIGEGLIHLRGPLKGVNQIRMMINQIDTPVGQVRVNVHSTQINGDEAEKLEVVSSRIQTYVDQARFMSVQTGEMLRKSVMAVAGQRAEEARTLYPGYSQQERDQRYLYAFFGKDFVDELRAIDSEFLHTGNKLISLHSMDVTSLSSALLLMSLANNSTREMILNEFERHLQHELPVAEARYLDAGMHPEDCHCLSSDQCDCHQEGKLSSKLRALWRKHHGPPPVYSLAQNAAFQSLRGFYDGNLMHDQTMTPLQREFVRLAQIFKSRLITELEYKQRVMERALIEDRLGNRQQDLRNAQRLEDSANRQLADAQREKNLALESVVTQLTQTQAEIRRSANQANASLRVFNSNFKEFINDVLKPEQRIAIRDFRRSQSRALPETVQYYGTIIDKVEFRIVKHRGIDGRPIVALEVRDPGFNEKLEREVRQMLDISVDLAQTLGHFKFPGTEGTETVIAKLTELKDTVILDRSPNDPYAKLNYDALEEVAEQLVETLRLADITFKFQRELAERRRSLLTQLRQPSVRYQAYYEQWVRYRNEVRDVFETHPEKDRINQFLDHVDEEFDSLLRIDVSTEFRTREASEARRPLDHKKFLDMLIDDLEEKYIELMEGTRAHTANIDNYLKRLTTALDDDFNTQFYNPTFRNVRLASQWKDVEFGQTETTNVLANNREFAKVSPSATMEFDLPKRDILIKEGLDAALAIYDDVGALVNDPNLMALAAGQSGNPASDIGAGSGGGLGAVRSVLPTLEGSTQEGILAQNAGVRPRFESNVEKLIPDPAIYKFETGTGFEIRPVIEPDGQAVVFDFNYMYTTNVREPVRADEKHLGRVKRHFIDTDVQLANFELREVSRYTVALKAERTARGVPLLEDIPIVGVLWRPLPNREKSLQQNIIMAQATIFPTLFDLMGLRWAPAVADIDPLGLSDREFIVRGRHRFLENRVYDVSSSRVDEFLRVPEAERRADLYRSQSTISSVHPNGYRGEGLDIQNSELREGYQTERSHPTDRYIPNRSSEGSMFLQPPALRSESLPIESYPVEPMMEDSLDRALNNQQLPAPVLPDMSSPIYPVEPIIAPMMEMQP
ncbi:MAG: hypothetical protein AAGJ40_15120 [Planctomycetota bacterium]